MRVAGRALESNPIGFEVGAEGGRPRRPSRRRTGTSVDQFRGPLGFYSGPSLCLVWASESSGDDRRQLNTYFDGIPSIYSAVAALRTVRRGQHWCSNTRFECRGAGITFGPAP